MHISGWKINSYNCDRKEHGNLQNLKKELVYDLAAQVLGMYPKKMESICQNNICFHENYSISHNN